MEGGQYKELDRVWKEDNIKS